MHPTLEGCIFFMKARGAIKAPSAQAYYGWRMDILRRYLRADTTIAMI